MIVRMEHVALVVFWRQELDRLLEALPQCRLHDIALGLERPPAPAQYAAHPVLNWPFSGSLRYELAGRWRRFGRLDLGYARAESWKRRAEQPTLRLAKCALRDGELLLLRNHGGGPGEALRYPLPDPALLERYQAACVSADRRDQRVRVAVGELLLTAADLLAADQGRPDPGALLVARALAFVEERLDQDLDRAQVARALGCHPGHLSRLFRQHLGQAFVPWLRERRLRLACRLLSETALSVETIARSSGFGSATWLIRCFRAAYGCTPGAWRARGS